MRLESDSGCLQRWNEYSLCRVRVESEYRKSQVESKYEYLPAVLEYESEYGISVLEYGLEYRAPVLESSDLPSRNIPVSFFLHVQIRQGTSGSREGKILLQDSQVTSLLTYWRNCGTIYFTIFVTRVRIKESLSR